MLVRLSHLKALGYGSITKKVALPLPDEFVDLADQGTTVVSFRQPAAGRPGKHVKDLTAVDRFLWLKARHLVFYGLESDSPLAPLILWDIAHAAEIGTTISLFGDNQSASFLQRGYFSQSLELIDSGPGKRVFRKAAMLSVEHDAGLDAWTFGIPVGPDDATLLNVVVKRILELDVPVKEILLCGRPGANFKYLDQVRIVGEDITAPPVKICEKKNRLAEEARHPNLCIIHDRIFLPLDFYSAVKRFGDCYPLTTLQSIFFDDKFNLVPRRYSDFGISYRAKISVSKGLMRDNDVSAPNVIAPAVLPLVELSGFYAANVQRYDMGAYPTGSMYLCKRSVWLANPQNENLHWVEFEDLEHAYRATESGVPSRVNPYTLTQSLISRPLLGRVGGSFIEPIKGPPRLIRAWSEFLPLPRKPAIKMTYEGALAGMRRFADKYISSSDPILIPSSAVLRSARRLETIVDILCRVEVPLREKAVREFVRDFEKLIVMDQLPFSFIEHVCHRLLVDRVNPVKALVEDNDILLNHFANRPDVNSFCSSMEEYLQIRSPFVSFSTMISAIYLYFRRRRIIYLKGGAMAYLRALKNTTPFRTDA